MSDLDPFPTSIPCGFCGASTALEREQLEELSIGLGACPKCRHMVISVAGPSVDVVAFVDFLESIDFPKERDFLPVSLRRLKASGLQGCRL